MLSAKRHFFSLKQILVYLICLTSGICEAQCKKTMRISQSVNYNLNLNLSLTFEMDVIEEEVLVLSQGRAVV